MQFILTGLTTLMFTALVTPLVIRLATACRCLDIPGGRRLHKKATPRWGGLAFFIGVFPMFLAANDGGTLTAFIAAASLLMAVGVVDDRRELGWKVKFAGMAAAATIIIFNGNIVVHDLGTYGSLGRVNLGWSGIPFTYLGIIGVTNAINLLDGLNGLAGGVSLLGFLFLGIAAVLGGNIPVALVCFAFVGALSAFLRYNFPNARIFMGDSGSLFLGFSLATTAVLLTQNTRSAVEPMFPVLVLLLPLFDTLRVLIVRLLKGRNPFRADKGHMHHLIVRRGVSPVVAVLLFWATTAAFGGFALMLRGKTSAAYLVFAFYAVLLLSFIVVGITQKRQRRRYSLPVTGYRTIQQRHEVPVAKLSADY